jgi:hypothetical protein
MQTAVDRRRGFECDTVGECSADEVLREQATRDPIVADGISTYLSAALMTD